MNETSTCILHIASDGNEKRIFDKVGYSIWFVRPYFKNQKRATTAILLLGLSGDEVPSQAQGSGRGAFRATLTLSK